jgi:hypothetical protein
MSSGERTVTVAVLSKLRRTTKASHAWTLGSMKGVEVMVAEAWKGVPGMTASF